MLCSDTLLFRDLNVSLSYQQTTPNLFGKNILTDSNSRFHGLVYSKSPLTAVTWTSSANIYVSSNCKT